MTLAHSRSAELVLGQDHWEDLMGTIETIVIVAAVYVLVFIAHHASRGAEQPATDES